MMRLGCALIVLGFALVIAGIVWVGIWFFEPWGAREVVRLDVPIGNPVVTDVLTLTPDSRCVLELEATVNAEKGDLRIFKKDGPGVVAEVETFVPLFRFPIVYRVTDENGRELASHTAALGGEPNEHESADFSGVGPQGGVVEVRSRFPIFTAPASGKVRVEATMFPDEGNGATAESVHLIVSDRVPPSPEATTFTWVTPFAGLATLALGAMVFVVGFFVWLIRQFTEPSPPRVVVVRS